MLVIDYKTKIEEICDSLSSINVMADEEEMVQICLGGLAPKYKLIWTTIYTREKLPSFFDLESMILVEENHIGVSMTMHTDRKMLYTKA